MFPQAIQGLSSSLEPVTRPMPKLQAHEVLIQVRYAGINRADLFQRQGSYAPPEGVTDIPGLEVSGTIAAVGCQVTRWQVGDAVCALLPGGGYADFAVAHESLCLPIPVEGDFALAAALPECVVTVWMALFETAGLQPGETVLVHGGASGIGTTAIQMIRAAGAQAFVTAGSDDKCRQCEKLGAIAINYHTKDFVVVLKEQGGADIVLDMVGGDYIAKNIKALKPHGRLISIACLNGGEASVPAGSILLKQIRWQGLTLRNRSEAEKGNYIKNIEDIVWPWVKSGKLRPIIDSVWPLRQAVEAQEKMEKRLHCGKILLQVAVNSEPSQAI
jgi:NADPH2:quinone reductase